MAREEYEENPKYLLRNALENASSRLIERATTLQTEADRLRSDARRIGNLATIYGTTPATRLRAMARTNDDSAEMPLDAA